MKKKQLAKKSLAVVLSVALLAPTSAFAASPSDFSDFPNDWSTQAMTEAVENGLLGGVTDTTIAPQGKLTRAQMATIINRAFGATAQASLSGYTDVASNAWYYSDMAKAVQMGTFVGVGSGRLNPDAEITREEAFCVLSRAFGIDTASASSLSRFSDSGDVSSWAAEAVAGMIASGYVGGYDDGGLHPKSTITRAEFASVMSRLVETYVSAAGDVSEDVDGNMIVRSADVHLQNMTIDGDLILADGIGTGDVTLEGVSVNGRILIRGGGSNGVHIIDSTIKGGVTLNNPNDVTNIEVENSTMGTVKLQTDAIINGDIENVEVAEGIEVTVASGTVQNMTVSEGAASAAISVADKAGIDKVTVQADDVTIDGEGTVGSVAANADNVAVNTVGTEVTAAEGTSGVTAGGVEVPAGETVVSGEGTTGGGTIRPPAVEEEQAIEVDSWQELRNAVQTVEAGGTIRLTADIKDAGADVDAIDGVSSATLPMEGEGDGKYFTLDGDGHTISAAKDKTFCFLIASVGGTTTVKDLTIDGASFSSKMGGAFFVEGGEAAFQNVIFKNCTAASPSATNGGGAILVNNHGGNAYPNVTIEGCTFKGNKAGVGATGRGGAVYANNFNTTPGSEGKERIKVTIIGSTFSGNQAAYGTAIAADGNVDLTVEGCTFTDQEGTDIYIYEGASAGKKSRTIYSNVIATLTDNIGAEAIYSRYYPASYSVDRGTAPEGAEDVTFGNIERTQERGTLIPMDIAGHTYYYGSATYEADGTQYATFTVNGEAVEAQKIGDANAYFYAADPFEGDDVVYAKGGTMSYADFYAELADDAEGIDAVSSATSSKNTIFTYADSTTPDDSGYKINGVKNLPVEVKAAQYAQGTILEALHQLTDATDAGQKAASELANTAISEKPGVYTSMNASGEYSNKLTVNDAKKTTVDSANLEIETSSRWGDYLLKVIETDTENLRNDRNTGWPVGENILGAIVTATKGDQTMNVGMKHLQNIWVQPYEIAFRLADGDDYADLEGATVTQITYIVPEGLYVYTFNENNLIKPQYDEVKLSANFNAEKTNVTISGIPGDLEDVVVNIYQNKGHGQKTMLATDATPVDGVVTLDAGAAVDETVTYTVQITSSNYADLQTTVTAAEAVEPGEGEQTRTGEATVQTYGYTAKVTVVYDPVTGKIVSVSDNDTDAGGNSMFWNYLSSVNTHEGNAFWAQFEGLDRAGVEALQINPTGSTQNTGEDNVDAVSGATYSSAAVKQAVLNALPSDGQ